MCEMNIQNAQKSRKHIYLGATLLWLALCGVGCSWLEVQEDRTAEQLSQEGMVEFNQQRYQSAIEKFEKLKDWYPFSPHAISAELRLADSHYYLKEYDEAAAKYQEFEGLHPKHESVPYAIYQIGRCHFDRLDTIDRDQTRAQEAVGVFERLIKNYPDSPQAFKAKEHIWVCQKSLAEHDFYVGMFYYKSKHFEAAKERFKAVVRAYPDSGVHNKAVEYIVLCEERMADSTAQSSQQTSPQPDLQSMQQSHSH